MMGTFSLFSSWERWIVLLLTIMTPLATDAHDIPDHSYANSSIDSQTPQRQRKHAWASSAPRHQQRPLSSSDSSDNDRRAYNDAIDVINVLFMPAWGCIHLRCE